MDERKPSWIFHLSQFTVFLEERKLLNNLPQEDEAMEATPVKIEQGEVKFYSLKLLLHSFFILEE